MLGVYLVDMRYLHKDQSVVEINQIDKENNSHAGESWCSYSAPVGGTYVRGMYVQHNGQEGSIRESNVLIGKQIHNHDHQLNDTVKMFIKSECE